MKQYSENGIVLSITIPTLNRRALLEQTLDLIFEQSEQALVPLQISVCDNASDDGTIFLFTNGGRFENLVQYVRFDKRVEIDESFSRAISISKGKFILLFGDDDIPLPGFILQITKIIALNLECSLIYINRIIGDVNLNNTTEVPHPDSPFGIKVMPIDAFIRTFTHWPGFVSCLVFSIDSWERSSQEQSLYDGYNFLNRIYVGSKNKSAIYIGSPLVLQRRGIQAWKKHWPKYWLISVPRLLANQESNGITFGAVKSWHDNEVTTKRFFIDCFVAKAYNYSINSDFWSESRKYQTSKIRTFISFSVQFFVPSIFAKFIYSKTNKMT